MHARAHTHTHMYTYIFHYKLHTDSTCFKDDHSCDLSVHSLCVTVPERPADIKAVSAGPHSVMVAWRPPLHSNGPLLKYTLTVRDVSDKQVDELLLELPPSEHSHLVANLSTNHQYGFHVATSTVMGDGEPTREVVASTQDTGATYHTQTPHT